jgi:glucose/arabinose dehydrogenase
MRLSLLKLAGCGVAAAALLGGTAIAAGPPPPTSTNGHAVQTVVASGLGTPTSFAFAAGNVFEGDGGVMSNTGQITAPGGVFLLKGGQATRLKGSPAFVAGLTWRKGTLYVSAGPKILAWSGWNGSQFAKQKVLYTAPKKFTGFNGLGFAANGRLYAGVSLASNGDHGPPTTPYAYDILSFNSKGKDLKILAQGIRQPWQMVFPNNSSAPLVSDLGQDMGAKNPPDFVLRVNQGDNFGFPNCNWTKTKACKGFAKPFKLFSPHTDVMGLGIIGKTLYMSEFVGNKGASGLVVSMPLSGGTPKTLLTGFVAPVVGLGVHGGWVYVGELTGQVFRVRP